MTKSKHILKSFT